MFFFIVYIHEIFHHIRIIKQIYENARYIINVATLECFIFIMSSVFKVSLKCKLHWQKKYSLINLDVLTIIILLLCNISLVLTIFIVFTFFI